MSSPHSHLTAHGLRLALTSPSPHHPWDEARPRLAALRPHLATLRPRLVFTSPSSRRPQAKATLASPLTPLGRGSPSSHPRLTALGPRLALTPRLALALLPSERGSPSSRRPWMQACPHLALASPSSHRPWMEAHPHLALASPSSHRPEASPRHPEASPRLRLTLASPRLALASWPSVRDLPSPRPRLALASLSSGQGSPWPRHGLPLASLPFGRRLPSPCPCCPCIAALGPRLARTLPLPRRSQQDT